jgi:acyl carrier protein
MEDLAMAQAQAQVQELDSVIEGIFWESLEGGTVDTDALKKRLRVDSDFRDLGIDSLDLVDFVVRVQGHFKITISQEEFPGLMSLEAMRHRVEEKQQYGSEMP